MAVNTVSTLTSDNWQQIATASLTGVNKYNFTGLSGYKKYMLVWSGTTTASSTNNLLYINATTTTTAAYVCSLMGTSSSQSAGYQDLFYLSFGATTTSGGTGYIIIDNANSTVIPKAITGVSTDNFTSYSWNINGAFLSASAISNLDFTNGNNYNYTAGTVTLYGIAA